MGLESGYAMAALASSSEVAPVGGAWMSTMELGLPIELYAADGSHPSLAGSYLAGCVLFGKIVGQPCTTAPTRRTPSHRLTSCNCRSSPIPSMASRGPEMNSKRRWLLGLVLVLTSVDAGAQEPEDAERFRDQYESALAEMKLGKPENFERCADMLIALYNEFSDFERADEILFNAAVCAEMGGRMVRPSSSERRCSSDTRPATSPSRRSSTLPTLTPPSPTMRSRPRTSSNTRRSTPKRSRPRTRCRTPICFVWVSIRPTRL